jgi:hypothetical protein
MQFNNAVDELVVASVRVPLYLNHPFDGGDHLLWIVVLNVMSRIGNEDVLDTGGAGPAIAGALGAFSGPYSVPPKRGSSLVPPAAHRTGV